MERLWLVTRLGVRLVTHWETAWVWLAASYAFGSGWGLIGDLGADFVGVGSSGEGEREDGRTVRIEQIFHLLVLS